MKLNRKVLVKEQLRVEDVASKLIEYSTEETEIKVSVLRFLKRYEIRFSCPGEEFAMAELQQDYQNLLGDEEETNAVIRRLSATILGKNIKLQNREHVNYCTLLKEKEERGRVLMILTALILGCLAGFALKSFAPASVSQIIATDIFGCVSKLFINAMKMIVAPLVFFSISASIAEFSDLKAFGRIAIKVFCCYLCTSCIAILVGYSVYQLIPIGDPAFASLVTESSGAAVASGSAAGVSLKDTILGIVPTDFITPFLESNMLQVIFAAILMGIAVSALANEHKQFKGLIISAYAVFGKITSIIVSFLPIAVFCNMAKMTAGIDLSELASIALWIPTCYLGYFFMVLAYGLLLLIFRLNPLKFYKAYSPAAFTAFSLSSSTATIPMSVKMCDERLGISKKLYSFSIPFGATVNMDGTCVTLTITSFFMAKIFGIPITPSLMFTAALAILLLSIGAPGVPGSTLVCISMLMPQIGVPAEAVTLFMAMNSLTGLGQTLCNCTGDAAVTTIVAKTEKLIDLEKFNAN